MVLQTEYEFTLPKGYVDNDGTLHKNGTMRLAAAADEILPMKDPRVQSNPAYLTVILLSRVITKLGELGSINPGVIEKLFVADLTYLQEFYKTVNGNGDVMMKVKCPGCGEEFEKEISSPGG
ncbi:MAG: phage tail assembly protein [Candidatus Aminicenantes bacterium]|nr:phage tail assembly protein [Candidatus Aminicenantes bacterium]